MPDQQKAESIASRFEYWFAVYALYLFLAGWTYLDYYFAVFGASVSWLELGLNDTLAQGFIVLFGTGVWMSCVYLIVLLIALILEIFVKDNSRFISTIATLVLVVMFVPAYYIAKGAAVSQANIDRGPKTTLPTVTFSEKGCTYRGDLLHAKGGLLYVHNLVRVADTTPKSAGKVPVTASAGQAREQPIPAALPKCPIEAQETSGTIPQLWLVRVDDLEDVRIVHYQKEAIQ